MENGNGDSSESEQKAECLKWFTDIATRAYESVLRPSDTLERLDNEGKGQKVTKMEFDFDNTFGQRILACTQHHYECITMYRKYFTDHAACQHLGDEVTTKAARLVDKNQDKPLSNLLLRHMTELLNSFEDWRDLLDNLHDTSLTVPPVKKRLSSTTTKNQVEAIYHITEDENFEVFNYHEKGVRFAELGADEGEKFVLLDSTNRMFWTVKNRHGEVGELPSLFLTNSAPDSTLVRKSSRLEDEFTTVVRKVMHLLESCPTQNNQTKEILRRYSRMLLSATKRSIDPKSMPKSPILSAAQSRESLLDRDVEEKIIEYTTTITEVTIVEDTTCFAPEYSEFTGQEVQMFLIAGVIDPRNFMEISIEEAREAGIVDMENGLYNNIETGESMPISEAMEQGLIRVEKSVTKKHKEKETKRRARSYEDLL